jgi:hypothetical protein
MLSTQAAASSTFSLGNRPLTGVHSIGVSLLLISHSNFQTLPDRSPTEQGIGFVPVGFDGHEWQET